jgi:hypothetical protein
MFGPGEKTQGVLKTRTAYFHGGFDSIFWLFRENVKNDWAAAGLRLLHSQLAFKTLL